MLPLGGGVARAVIRVTRLQRDIIGGIEFVDVRDGTDQVYDVRPTVAGALDYIGAGGSEIKNLVLGRLRTIAASHLSGSGMWGSLYHANFRGPAWQDPFYVSLRIVGSAAFTSNWRLSGRRQQEFARACLDTFVTQFPEAEHWRGKLETWYGGR